MTAVPTTGGRGDARVTGGPPAAPAGTDRGAAAWVVPPWALREHRPLAHRLSTPAGAKLAKGAVLAAAKWRGGQWGGQVYRRSDGWTYDPPVCGSGTCGPRRARSR